MSLKFNKFFVITCLLIGHVHSQDIKNSIPAIGDRVSGVVSLEQEKQIGTQFLKQIYAQAPLVNDALIQEFTELLIYKISETSLVQDRDFKLVIIDDRSLNAFAAPGGVIGVNAGLFIHAENEAQFASVIAHDLAHVSPRHFASGSLRGQDTNLASALVLISSIALAIISNNPGAFIAGPAALAQEQLRYSRIFEREADRFGFNNLINAGYDPRSMGEMFENMAKLRKLSGDLPPEFLLTHPVTSSRISDAFNAVDQVGIVGGKTNSPDFQFIKGRIEAQYHNSNLNSEAFFKQKYSRNPSVQNAISYVTVLSKNQKFSEAKNILSTLLENFPKNITLKVIEAEIFFNDGDLDRALSIVDEILKLAPNNFPASVLKAKVLEFKGEFLFAEQLVRDQLIKRNNDPDLWFLLSEIQRSAKNIIGYHLSKGEYFILLGQYDRALNELKFALSKVENNFQVTETIFSKMDEIKSLEKNS